MSQQLNEGYKLFGFIDQKFRESISAFILGATFCSVGWFIFYSFMRSTAEEAVADKEEVIQDLKRDVKDHKVHIKILEEKLYKFDEECSNRLMFFSNLMEEMKNNSTKAKNKSMSLADTEANSVSQFNKIEKKIKSKIE